MLADPHTVDRTVSRDLLLNDLESSINYGKKLAKFETNNTAQEVTAHSKDGTSTTGTLVVGADGLRSAVRKQYLPNQKVLDTGGRIRAYAGEAITRSTAGGVKAFGQKGLDEAKIVDV